MTSTRKYKLVFAPNALAMLSEHFDFLAQVSKDAARRLMTKFKDCTKRISDRPLQFPFADDVDVSGMPPQTYRKCLFEHRYKILYLIEGEKILVDAIIDARKENKDLFESDLLQDPERAGDN